MPMLAPCVIWSQGPAESRWFGVEDDLVGQDSSHCDGHPQRGLDEIGAQMVGQVPADHPP
jgi:hypothetical protein